MNKFSNIAVGRARLALSLTMVAALAACWGGGGSTPAPVKVATANVVVGAVNITPTQKTQSAATVVAVSTAAATTPITFPTGFSGTDANGAAVALPAVATEVTFATNTADATQPKFAIVSGTDHFEGLTVMGSCSFVIQTSTYRPPSAFAVGQTFKVDPCTVTLPSAGRAADGTSISGNVAVTFGTTSITVILPVSVSGDGTIAIGGLSLGGVTVTVTSTTGA